MICIAFNSFKQKENFARVGYMELFTATIITHKWYSLSILASFFGLLLLSLYLHQGWQHLTILPSIGILETNNTNNFKSPTINITISTEPLESIAPLPSNSNIHASNIELSSYQVTHYFSPKKRALVNSSSQERLDVDEKCDIFDGRWVYDSKDYPLYHVHQCPFLSDQVRCQKNGRPDSSYEHWRWEARGCDIPRFKGRDMLERLRGKRMVIVGDSLNRNQWESLACLLYSSIHPSRAIVTSRGSEKIFRALDYNFSLEFFWSPFLVSLDELDGGAKVLKLDKLSESARWWRGADVMVFNTGHWWTHRGKLRAWKYFEHNGELVEEMEGNTAFTAAMKTWAQWIDRKVDPAKTVVFFRSISPEHKQANRHWCYNQTQPITNETYVQSFPGSMVSAVERTIQEMRVPVRYLNITRLSEYRRDAHTSVYTARQGKLLTGDQRRQPESYADCSHWCLPGLPDTWNVLLYASIVGNH